MFSKSDIEKYFIAEKNACLLFMIAGGLSVIAAAVFFFGLKTNFFKGIALPLLLLGLLEFFIGYTIYKRSDTDRMRNVYAYDLNPRELKSKEIPRMEKVTKSFTIYRWAEIGFFAVAVGLIFLFRSNIDKQFWFGFGIGLAVQAALLFIGDSFAEARAKKYYEGLQAHLSAPK